MRRFLFLIPVLFLFGCDVEQKKEEAKISEYFDLSGTLDQMVNDLIAQKAKLEKTIVLNGEKEEVLVTPADTAHWKRELELFYDADINKLGLSGAYQTENLEAFDGIKKVIHTAINKGAYVNFMECAYRDGKLFTVRISASDKNMVYSTKHEYTLYFNHFKKKLALNHYAIKVEEQMLLKSDMSSEVTVRVVKP